MVSGRPTMNARRLSRRSTSVEEMALAVSGPEHLTTERNSSLFVLRNVRRHKAGIQVCLGVVMKHRHLVGFSPILVQRATGPYHSENNLPPACRPLLPPVPFSASRLILICKKHCCALKCLSGT